jgi:3-hydroxybutyrate dehydrogenase
MQDTTRSVKAKGKKEGIKSHNGKVVIVTGGANGIGRSIAETLARDGDKVVVVDIAEKKGREVARLVGGYFVKADLALSEDCRNAVERTVVRFGTVDILVNNAGFQHIDNIADFPEETWDKMMAVMLRAPFLLTKYVWRYMASKKWGRIVNISSVHGLVASSSKSAYVSAKHGLIGLTRVAALEGGPLGITVNAICPAYVRTDLVENQIDDQARVHNLARDQVVKEVFLERVAVKRLIEPNEIASLVGYICSEEASAISGSALTIDLGWTAG